MATARKSNEPERVKFSDAQLAAIIQSGNPKHLRELIQLFQDENRLDDLIRLERMITQFRAHSVDPEMRTSKKALERRRGLFEQGKEAFVADPFGELKRLERAGEQVDDERKALLEAAREDLWEQQAESDLVPEMVRGARDLGPNIFEFISRDFDQHLARFRGKRAEAARRKAAERGGVTSIGIPLLGGAADVPIREGFGPDPGTAAVPLLNALPGGAPGPGRIAEFGVPKFPFAQTGIAAAADITQRVKGLTAGVIEELPRFGRGAAFLARALSPIQPPGGFTEQRQLTGTALALIHGTVESYIEFFKDPRKQREEDPLGFAGNVAELATLGALRFRSGVRAGAVPEFEKLMKLGPGPDRLTRARNFDEAVDAMDAAVDWSPESAAITRRALSQHVEDVEDARELSRVVGREGMADELERDRQRLQAAKERADEIVGKTAAEQAESIPEPRGGLPEADPPAVRHVSQQALQRLRRALDEGDRPSMEEAAADIARAKAEREAAEKVNEKIGRRRERDVESGQSSLIDDVTNAEIGEGAADDAARGAFDERQATLDASLPAVGAGVGRGIRKEIVERARNLDESLLKMGFAEQFAFRAAQRGYTTEDDLIRAAELGQKLGDEGLRGAELGNRFDEAFPKKGKPAPPAPAQSGEPTFQIGDRVRMGRRLVYVRDVVVKDDGSVHYLVHRNRYRDAGKGPPEFVPESAVKEMEERVIRARSPYHAVAASAPADPRTDLKGLARHIAANGGIWEKEGGLTGEVAKLKKNWSKQRGKREVPIVVGLVNSKRGHSFESWSLSLAEGYPEVFTGSIDEARDKAFRFLLDELLGGPRRGVGAVDDSAHWRSVAAQVLDLDEQFAGSMSEEQINTLIREFLEALEDPEFTKGAVTTSERAKLVLENFEIVSDEVQEYLAKLAFRRAKGEGKLEFVQAVGGSVAGAFLAPWIAALPDDDTSGIGRSLVYAGLGAFAGGRFMAKKGFRDAVFDFAQLQSRGQRAGFAGGVLAAGGAGFLLSDADDRQIGTLLMAGVGGMIGTPLGRRLLDPTLRVGAKTKTIAGKSGVTTITRGGRAQLAPLPPVDPDLERVFVEFWRGIIPDRFIHPGEIGWKARLATRGIGAAAGGFVGSLGFSTDEANPWAGTAGAAAGFFLPTMIGRRLVKGSFNPWRTFQQLFTTRGGLPEDAWQRLRAARISIDARSAEAIDTSLFLFRRSAEDPDLGNVIDRALRGQGSFMDIEDLSVRQAAVKLRFMFDQVGLDLIEVGLATGDVARVIRGNLGTYLPRLYLKWERQSALLQLENLLNGEGKTLKRFSDLDGLKHRKDLSPDQRIWLEEISSEFGRGNVGVLGLRRLPATIADIEMARYANFIASSEYTIPNRIAKKLDKVFGKDFKGSLLDVLPENENIRTVETFDPNLRVVEWNGLRYQKLPTTKKLGHLRGRWVDENVAQDLAVWLDAPKSLYRAFFEESTAAFKQFKVTMNPSTLIRNVFGFLVMSDVSGGVPVWNIKHWQQAMRDYLSAENFLKVKGAVIGGGAGFLGEEIRQKGGGEGGETRSVLTGLAGALIGGAVGGRRGRQLDRLGVPLGRPERYFEARTAGLFGNQTTFFGAEVRDQLTETVAQRTTKAAIKKADEIAEQPTMYSVWLGWAAKKAQKTDVRIQSGLNRMARFHEGSEHVNRMSLYNHARDKLKMKPAEAVQFALKHGFDYREVPRWIKHMRKSPWGAPFITFSYKSLPRTFESAVAFGNPRKMMRFWKYPIILGSVNEASMRIHGLVEEEGKGVINTLKRIVKSGLGLDNLGGLRKLMPDYLGSNQILWPFKDGYGRFQFFDATWHLPWGDITEVGKGSLGKNLASMGIDFPRQLEPQNPWFQLIVAMTTGRDPFTDQELLSEADKSSGYAPLKIMQYILRQFGPSWLPGAGFGSFKVEKALSGGFLERPDIPTVGNAMKAAYFGFTVRPLDPVRALSFRKWEQGDEQQKLKREYDRARRGIPLKFAEQVASYLAGRGTVDDLPRSVRNNAKVLVRIRALIQDSADEFKAEFGMFPERFQRDPELRAAIERSQEARRILSQGAQAAGAGEAQ